MTHHATEQIRVAIRARIKSGESIREIARQSGHDHSQLARFLRGERGLATGEKLDGLLRVLGLRLTHAIRGGNDGRGDANRGST